MHRDKRADMGRGTELLMAKLNNAPRTRPNSFLTCAARGLAEGDRLGLANSWLGTGYSWIQKGYCRQTRLGADRLLQASGIQ
jgi:hypothetical protein